MPKGTHPRRVPRVAPWTCPLLEDGRSPAAEPRPLCRPSQTSPPGCNRKLDRHGNSDSDPQNNRRGCSQDYEESNEDRGGDCELGRDRPSGRQGNNQSDGERNRYCDPESNRGHSLQSNQDDGVDSETECSGESSRPRNRDGHGGDDGGDFPEHDSTTWYPDIWDGLT